MFVPGQVCKRTDIHDQYGGQRQGGISTPAGHPMILLFSSGKGDLYGYRDGWDAERGLFLYTGEGQAGDMQFVRGNQRIRDHADDGRNLHLFEHESQGYWRYVGQMVCTGYHYENRPDVYGGSRKTIIFELTPIDAFETGPAPTAAPAKESIAQLRQKAMAASSEGKDPVARKALVRERSVDVRRYVLARANGVCEACGAPAPFKTTSGQPYLEPHHIRRLSDGGPDDPRWVGRVCPNCRARAHYGADDDEVNKRLTEVLAAKEGPA